MTLSPQEYALLAANVYGNSAAVRSPENTLNPASGWTVLDRRNSITGFMGATYAKGSEIVVAFAGTTAENPLDWATGNIPAGSGLFLAPQIAEAARYYLDVVDANPGMKVTVTGHSLGGGLASLVGVWFGVAATVFDAAPFLLSATSPSIVTQLYAADPLRANRYPLSLLVPLSVPQNLHYVSEYLTKGEILEVGSALKIRPLSQRYEYAPSPITVGPWAEMGASSAATELHSMTLLAAMVNSDRFYELVQKYREVIPTLNAGTFGLLSPDSPQKQIFEMLVNSQTHGQGGLDFLADTLMRIKRFGQMRGDAVTGYSQGIATLMDFVLAGMKLDMLKSPTAPFNAYLEKRDYSIVADFALLGPTSPLEQTWQLTPGEHVTLSDKMKALYQFLTGRAFLESDAFDYRWTFQNRVAPVYASYTDERQDVMLGGISDDNLFGGGGKDYLVGGAGNDFLAGGAGDDFYVYSAGDGTDVINDFEGKNVLLLTQYQKSWVKTYNLAGTYFLDLSGQEIVFKDMGSVSALQSMTIQFSDGAASLWDLVKEKEYNPTESPEHADSGGSRYFTFNVAVEESNPESVMGWTLQYYKNHSFTLDASCLGHSANLQSNAGSDLLIGSAYSDSINAGEGDDFIAAGAGDDALGGGSADGHLTAYGDSGDDRISVWAGGFSLYGGDGDDYITVTSATGGLIEGGAGKDRIFSGDGNDSLNGDSGDDHIIGGAGDDTLTGGAGANFVDGGVGDDVFVYTKGEYLLMDDISGFDTLRLTGVKLSDVKFRESVDNFESNPFYRQRGIEISGADIHVFINLFAQVERIEFADGVLTYAQYRTLARTVVLSDKSEQYGVSAMAEDSSGYLINGFGGDDLLIGSTFGDTINGGLGSDRVIGGDGEDILWGGAAGAEDEDVLEGGSGNDKLYSQSSQSYLYGGAGADVLAVLQGQGYLDGDDGDDQLWGGAGSDVLEGGFGNDYLHGGQGGSDVLNGGLGNDTLVINAGDATLNGGDGADQLWGGTGNDKLVSDDNWGHDEGFNDYLNGGSGNNSLYGGGGSDRLITLQGEDLLLGGYGTDTLWAGAGNDKLYGDLEYMVGSANGVNGGPARYSSNVAQVDYLYGEAGNDLLQGGRGRNLLVGGEGDDTLLAGGVFLEPFNGTIQVYRGDVDMSDFLWGGTGNDTLVGNGGDYLYGEAGDDVLRSLKGSNTLNGGGGNDTFYGGDTASNMFGGDGADTMSAGNAWDKLYGGEGNDQLTANGADTLQGDNGNDLLISVGGSNVLWGGAGDDTLTTVSSGVDHLRGQSGLDFYNLRGTGTYHVYEDTSGGVVSMNDMFEFAELASAKLANYDQLVFRFTNGASVNIYGWSTQAVAIRADGRDLSYAEVMQILPSLGQA